MKRSTPQQQDRIRRLLKKHNFVSGHRGERVNQTMFLLMSPEKLKESPLVDDWIYSLDVEQASAVISKLTTELYE